MSVSVTELSLWSHRINVIVRKAQEGRLVIVRVRRNHSEGHRVFMKELKVIVETDTQSHCKYHKESL